MRYRYCPHRRKIVTLAEWIDLNGDPDLRSDTIEAPMIQKAFEPYRSMVTGETIDGRTQHQAHLRRHNLQEVGSAVPDWIKERRYVRKHGGDPNVRDAPPEGPIDVGDGVTVEVVDQPYEDMLPVADRGGPDD